MSDLMVTRKGKRYMQTKAQREAAAAAEHAAQQQRLEQSGERRSFRDVFGDDPFDEQPRERRCPLVGRISA